MGYEFNEKDIFNILALSIKYKQRKKIFTSISFCAKAYANKFGLNYL